MTKGAFPPCSEGHLLMDRRFNFRLDFGNQLEGHLSQFLSAFDVRPLIAKSLGAERGETVNDQTCVAK